MKKFKVIAAIVFFAVAGFFATQIISSDANADPNPLPGFNIRVMQVGGTNYQNGAEVVYMQGSTTVHTGTTFDNGWYYTTLPTGTYDVYVYYPARPLDGQSGNLLNYYHSGDDYKTIVLGPNY
ncbi:MAG: hypothetical protein WAT71_00150 [Ignavibacteria bacterium]